MVARLVRDQKVAGSNPVTSTKFIRICESKSGFFVPHFWSNRTQADNPPFGCERKTTDNSGLMYFVVCFGRPFGKNQSWADVSGNGRSEVENNAVPKGDILEARQIFYMQRCVRSSFRSSNPQPQSVKQAWAHSIRPLSLNRISMSVPFTFFNMIRRSSCSMNPSFTSVIGFLSMA